MQRQTIFLTKEAILKMFNFLKVVVCLVIKLISCIIHRCEMFNNSSKVMLFVIIDLYIIEYIYIEKYVSA